MERQPLGLLRVPRTFARSSPSPTAHPIAPIPGNRSDWHGRLGLYLYWTGEGYIPEIPLTLEELYQLLGSSHVQAQRIVDTLQEPLVVLHRDMVVVAVNPSFLRTFKVERDVMLDEL